MSQIKLEFRSAGFWAEQKTGVPGEKSPEARTKTNNKLYPHVINAKTWTRAIHWWEATVHPWPLGFQTLISAQWFPILFTINILNSCGTIFIIFTHSHDLFVWSSKNNTRRNEMPTTFVTVHYTFSLTAWLSPNLPFGGVGTNGTHRSHVKYLTIPTHSYNYDKQTLWVATAREFCIPSGPFTSNKSQINNKCWTFADVRWWQ